MESKILGRGEGVVQFSYFMYVTHCHLACFRRLIYDGIRLFLSGYRCFWGGCGWLLNFLRWLEMVEDVIGGCWYVLETMRFSCLILAGCRMMGFLYVKPKLQSSISYVLRHITCIGEWFLKVTITNIYTSQREPKGTMQDTYRS